MSNQAISKVELQKLIDTKNSFVALSVKYSLGINTDEFAKFPSFFDQRLTENQEQISSLGNELESVQGELTETQETLSQTQADLTETTANLQAKTEELNAFTEEVNGVKDGLKEVAQGVDPTFITDSTAFVDYPEQFEKVVASAEHFGYTAGVDEENIRWTTLVNSATATEEDVAKGKTFVDDYGEIKDGTLDVEAIKAEAEAKALDDMWEKIQAGGKRTYYSSFGLYSVWTGKNFKPKYDIRPTGAYAYRMFPDNSYGKAYQIQKLLEDGQVRMKDLEKERGIIFDFSKCTNMAQVFYVSPFSELNVIDLSMATSTIETFAGSYLLNNRELMLKKIERLICSETTVFQSNTFQNALEITYIGFEGVIAKNGLNVSWSTKLDKESHVKLVNTLSSTTSGLSVTVSQTAVNKAFETSAGANDGSTSQEWLNLIATKSNWTISLG